MRPDLVRAFRETRARVPEVGRFLARLGRDALSAPVPTPGPLAVRVVTDDAAFAGLRVAWDRLFTASGARSAFASFPWIHAWWMEIGRPAGHALRLYLVEQGGEVVGIAPLYLADRTLRTLGDTWVGSEHLDLLADGAPAVRADVAGAVARAIAADGAVDGGHLLDLDEHSALEPALSTAAGLVGGEGEPFQTLPFLRLPGSVAAWEASLSGNMRYNLRRKQKRLLKEHPQARVEHVTREDALPEALDLLFRLHGRRWQTKGETGNFVRPEVRAFHRRVAPRLLERGILRLYQLDLGGGRVVATLYCLRSGGRELYLQAGLDPAYEEVSAGFCLMHKVIEGAAADGLSEFDFLRGTEGYKTHWATHARTTRQVRFARRTARGVAWLGQDRLARDAKAIAKTALPPEAVAELRRKLRPRGD